LISNSVIRGNVTRAFSTIGPATVQGGGIVNNGLLELRNDQVRDNIATADGPTGFAQGGGIWNGVIFVPPPVELVLANTLVTRNTASASTGLTVQGGGVFTEFPVTLGNSRIEKNDPDDCFGCRIDSLDRKGPSRFGFLAGIAPPGWSGYGA
jgi:hypothetical protein